jgi:hypothetical protein
MSQTHSSVISEPLSDSEIILRAQESIDLQQARRDGNHRRPHDSHAALDEMIRLALGPPNDVCRPNQSPDKSIQSIGAAEDFSTQTYLGRFQLRKFLGHGSFGMVLLAFDPRLQREVALKIPRPNLIAQKRWRQRFIHEARTAAALDHPGIVPIYDVGHIGPVRYISSAYCDGPTLAEWQCDVVV